MNILLLGHCCLDVIHTPQGGDLRSFGGIVYAAGALGALMERKETVTPVFGINPDDREALLRELERYPTIDTSGIFPFPEPTNQVHLFYGNGGARRECSRHISMPIPWERIRPHLDTDAILINMVSGSDITLETLDQIRMQIRGRGIPLHFDFHSLTLGVQDDGTRVRRPLDTWRRWAFMNDTVQLNEEEIGGLTLERLPEERAVGHLLTLGIRGVVITRGPQGATLYTSPRKTVVRHDVPGIPVRRSADSTGCGDVFGAAFLLHAARTKDLAAAAAFANETAARNAGLSGTAELHRLRPDAAAA